MLQFIVRTVPGPSTRNHIRIGEYLGTYWAKSAADALRKAGRIAGHLTRKEYAVTAVPA